MNEFGLCCLRYGLSQRVQLLPVSPKLVVFLRILALYCYWPQSIAIADAFAGLAQSGVWMIIFASLIYIGKKRSISKKAYLAETMACLL